MLLVDATLKDWLALLCSMLPGVKSAVVFQTKEEDTLLIGWPSSVPVSESLLDAAKLAESQQSSLVISQETGLVFAHPISVSEKKFGAVALLVEANNNQQQAIKQLINWGNSWLELLLRHHDHTNTTDEFKLLPVLRSLVVLEPGVIEKSLVTQLADLYSADRVSLGFVTPHGIELTAISHRPTFDGRVNLAGMIQSAMLEAVLANGSIHTTNSISDHTAHELLSKQLTSKSLLTVPLVGSEPLGAIMLERQYSFSESEVESIEDVAAIVTPRFEQQRLIEMSPPQYFLALSRRWRAKAFYKTWTNGRLVAVAASVLLLMLLGLLNSTYNVTSRAILEGLSQQSVVAPFDGFIESAKARAGDLVTADELLATMDDRDILLELSRLENERDDFNRQYRQALADLDQAQSTILKARVDQADAKLAQLHRRLRQLELRAPISGVIISGDLSRALGAPLVKGDVLFEVAPLDAYRIVLHINERDIDEIRPGQSGLVTFSAHPDTKVPFTVQSITSVMTAEAGVGVVFRTEANISGNYPFLRPGMEGFARTTIGQRKLGWILFHDVADWFRLLIWRYLP